MSYNVKIWEAFEDLVVHIFVNPHKIPNFVRKLDGLAFYPLMSLIQRLERTIPPPAAPALSPVTKIRVTSKALNRENRLECIWQLIRVRFDHRLRAVVTSPFTVFLKHVQLDFSIQRFWLYFWLTDLFWISVWMGRGSHSLNAYTAQKTKSRGPKGIQLEVVE